MPRARHCNEMCEIPQLIMISPPDDLRDRVGSRDEEQLRTRPLPMQVAQRVDRVGGSRGIQFKSGGEEPGILRAGRHDHLPSVLRQGGRRFIGMIPRGKQIEPIQPAGFQSADRGLDMPLMNRIKGSAQNADSLFRQQTPSPFRPDFPDWQCAAVFSIIIDCGAGEKRKIYKKVLQFTGKHDNITEAATTINYYGSEDVEIPREGKKPKIQKNAVSGVFSNQDTVSGIRLSAILAASAAALACVIVVAAVNYIFKQKNKKRAVIVEACLLFPWLLPTILICYSYRIFFNDKVWYVFNQNLYTGDNVRILLIIAYTVVKLPFALRMIKAAFYAIDEELEDAARNLGASGLTTLLRIKLPIILPSVLAVFALNFNSLFTEYDMGATFFNPSAVTYARVIKAMADPEVQNTFNAPGRQCASTVFIMLVSGLILYLVYGVGARDLGERLERREKRRRFWRKITGRAGKEAKV